MMLPEAFPFRRCVVSVIEQLKKRHSGGIRSAFKFVPV